MKKFRTLIAALLTIVLPYAATASMVGGLACQHQQHSSVLVSAALPMHHDHAAMLRAQHTPSAAGATDTCHCPLTCDCAHHCAGAAVLMAATVALDARDRAAPAATPRGDSATDAQRGPLLRPPIAVLSGTV